MKMTEEAKGDGINWSMKVPAQTQRLFLFQERPGWGKEQKKEKGR